jgi:hypothetical protein
MDVADFASGFRELISVRYLFSDAAEFPQV